MGGRGFVHLSAVCSRSRGTYSSGQDRPGEVSAWRFSDLRTSLGRDQPRSGEELVLSDQALEESPASTRRQILSKEESALRQTGGGNGVIGSLREAALLKDGRTDNRLTSVLRYNLRIILVEVGQAHEEDAGLREVRELAHDLGFEAAIARCLWLEGGYRRRRAPRRGGRPSARSGSA